MSKECSECHQEERTSGMMYRDSANHLRCRSCIERVCTGCLRSSRIAFLFDVTFRGALELMCERCIRATAQAFQHETVIVHEPCEPTGDAL